jgi:hypothetical protein
MINPTKADIGRNVVYQPRMQVGVITTFTEQYVFVKYGSGSTSAATKREDLEWEVPPQEVPPQNA